MTTVYDVPAKALIDALTKKLQEDKAITPPPWSPFVKTGSPSENPPEDSNWWYVRCASVLRKIYIHNSIGMERLRNEYGGRRDRGSAPYHARSGSGAIARTASHQLEKAGFVTKVKGRGRILTPKGRSFLDDTAQEVKQKLIEQYPELKKY